MAATVQRHIPSGTIQAMNERRSQPATIVVKKKSKRVPEPD